MSVINEEIHDRSNVINLHNVSKARLAYPAGTSIPQASLFLIIM